jgi:hypothetical protein
MDAIYSRKIVPTCTGIRHSSSSGCTRIIEATGFPEACFNFYQIKQESHLIRWNVRVVHEPAHFFFWYNFWTYYGTEERMMSALCLSVHQYGKKATVTGNTFLEFFYL